MFVRVRVAPSRSGERGGERREEIGRCRVELGELKGEAAFDVRPVGPWSAVPCDRPMEKSVEIDCEQWVFCSECAKVQSVCNVKKGWSGASSVTPWRFVELPAVSFLPHKKAYSRS